MEVNTIKKKIRRGLIRIAYIYPSVYEAAISSIVFHMIYYYVNELYNDVYLERFVLKRLSGREPPPKSLDTGSPLRDFPLLIASIHYEPDYVHLIRILESGGIPAFRSERERRHLLVIGGPAPMANPAPIYDIADVIVVGEVEPLLPKLIEKFIECQDEPEKFLEELAGIDGFLVPKINDSVKRVWEKSINTSFYPVKQIQHVDKEPVYGRGVLVETSRGCPLWCRFCMETRLFKPYRCRSFTRLKEIVEEGIKVNNVNRVVIYSLFYPGNRDEKKFMEFLIDNNIKASLPSMRLDRLNEEILELIKSLGQKTITIAPENVSKYGVQVLSKYFNVKDLVDKPKLIIDKEFDVKAYFILGVKGETLDDIKTNIEYIRNLANHAKKKKRSVRITINPLIPKPWTAFQWIGMIELDRAKNIVSYVSNELKGLVDTRPLHINWAWIQASIALADKDIAKTLVVWAREGGDLGAWRRALKITSYKTDYVFKGLNYGNPLPWSNVVLDKYVEKVLEKEYEYIRTLIKT